MNWHEHPHPRRKLRGKKRRLRRILADEREGIRGLKLEDLQKRGYAYWRIQGTGDFTQPGVLQPPLWYYRQALRSLLRIHSSWKAQIEEGRVAATLQLWLFEPHRTETELYVTMAGPGRELPFRIADDQKPFPFHLYTIPELRAFQWTACWEDQHMDEQDLALEGLTEDALLATGWRGVANHAGVRYYYKATGRVWVGEML